MKTTVEADVLIIGSGLAGLLAAIKLLESGAHVVLVCKTGLAESNSRYAQGGIAAAAPPSANVSKTKDFVFSRNTPTESHLADTIKSGAGLVDEEIAKEIIGKGWLLIEELAHYGVIFDHAPDGAYSLAREGGHSAARVYHHQDVTGTWICNALITHLKSAKNLCVFEHTFVRDLLTQGGACIGALLDQEGQSLSVTAKHTVLATGGIGQVFSRTTNPTIATGDGIAMAYRAGADLVDMEFVQFHPTALHLPQSTERTTVLISEAVRGAGALLLDHNRERFMQRFDPAGELATRDIVSRSMYQIMQETGSKEIFLDLRPIGKEVLQNHFPHIVQQLKAHGIDALEEIVPVSPAAHYFMGGIKANAAGETSIPNLYAIGECACTGLHGANRLASNSLLEAGVMALDVAELIAKKSAQGGDKIVHESAVLSTLTVPSDLNNMRQLMFSQVGIIRDAVSLKGAITKLHNDTNQVSYSMASAEAANLLLIAKLIADSALRRQESRGAHYRSDYPKTDNQFAARQIVYKNVGAGVSPPIQSDDVHRIADMHTWIGRKDLCPSSN